jgi:hypothetical protein
MVFDNNEKGKNDALIFNYLSLSHILACLSFNPK